ncbi:MULTISPECIES: hypothetical protein [Pseudomonas syringae group]|uniref:hypothetical protein n=1 Tax=Pseudomonas syringae group TaxID=136849 RepID=UPI000B134572|nr:hypothetical protein [Pseudomonas caricapapayae]KAA8695968.1 hypothetical protein F4W67_10230 [Pseudomonas caricapapayae]
MDNSPKVVKESRAFYGLIRIISSLALLRLSGSCGFFPGEGGQYRSSGPHSFMAQVEPFL